MSQSADNTVRLTVSPGVARIVGPGAPREVQMTAARGALPLSGADLLTVLGFLCASADAEIKGTAVATLRELPAAILQPVLGDAGLHPRLLDLVARVRFADSTLAALIIRHPAVLDSTLLVLARQGSSAVLERLADNQLRLTPELAAAIIANPAAERVLKFRLGWREPEPEPDVSQEDGESAEDAEDAEQFPEAVDGDPAEIREVSAEDVEALLRAAEEKGLSKYQLAMDLKVSEKIKIAMTGDKEWRNILVKDPNKLVHGAVLKNGRITDGEVLMVAKNKTSSDELVRIILLNREWLKSYEVRKALITHPKTPLPRALRFIGDLTLKDLKNLARSRNVPSAVATTARKEVERKMKRGG